MALGRSSLSSRSSKGGARCRIKSSICKASSASVRCRLSCSASGERPNSPESQRRNTRSEKDAGLRRAYKNAEVGGELVQRVPVRQRILRKTVQEADNPLGRCFLGGQREVDDVATPAALRRALYLDFPACWRHECRALFLGRRSRVPPPTAQLLRILPRAANGAAPTVPCATLATRGGRGG